jgi:hypothetical protein
MGSTRFNPSDYAAYATSTAHRTVHDYATTTMKTDFDPKLIKVRESVMSAANPHPTPIIVGLDVSGSMGRVVEACRRGLGTLFEETIKRQPVSDPHVLAMAIGDMECDRFPVQATQFEADPVTIGKQIEQLTIERGGGGNDHESYLGPWYFAAMRTSCDAFKEGRKGYLFTVGDERPQMKLRKEEIARWFGDQPTRDYTASELLAVIERDWHVFHILVEEGDYMRGAAAGTTRAWREVMGQRAILLSDHRKMAEVIISTIEVTEGRGADEVAASWSGGTDLVVRRAIEGLPAGLGRGTSGAGPVAL